MLSMIKDDFECDSRWLDAGTSQECEAVIKRNSHAMDVWLENNQPVIIMCPPDYFYVDNGGGDEVAGNAFVKEGHKLYFANEKQNHEKMLKEWHAFKTLLEQCGAKVITMHAQDGFPDQVFTADHSFSCETFTFDGTSLDKQNAVTVISRLAHPNRGGEMNVVSAYFDSLTDSDENKPYFTDREVVKAGSYLEGIGDNLIDPYRGIILSGYGLRNAETSLLFLHKSTRLPVYQVMCKKPFFHIDTFFSALPDGFVLYAPEVMYEQSAKALELALFKGHQSLKDKYAIAVSKEDAAHFACNAVCVGKTVIMQTCSQALQDALAQKGINVIYTDATIANYAGGGLHCMSNTLNQPVFI